ncbi:MAG: hypothetical protein ACRC1H_09235 [Caldilineaceae bacterium]
MTALDRARDYFKSPGSQPLTTLEFCKRFNVHHSAAIKSLSILRYEEVITRERQPGNRFVYRKA